MKTTLTILILCILSGCFSIPIEKQRVLARESVVIAQICKDMQQTLDIARNPDRYHEINPLIGKHPSKRRVKNYFLLRAAVHSTVALSLPEEESRIWQVMFLIGSSALTQHNNSIGLKSDSGVSWYTEYSFKF